MFQRTVSGDLKWVAAHAGLEIWRGGSGTEASKGAVHRVDQGGAVAPIQVGHVGHGGSALGGQKSA